jgi:putative membrane-bound dehydrogenase-like protein
MQANHRIWNFHWLLIVCLAAHFLASSVSAHALEIRKGDHICLVGNGLGERLQFENDWEALLHARFPEHELVVRNLCFPADEPFRRDRTLNFGSPDEHLAHSKADVILFFFGFNESFQGKPGLGKFMGDLTRLINETQTKDYSGRGAPRIVLISPIAHEDLGDPNVTDGKAHNEDLAAYTAAMAKVARTTGVGFVDLFAPTQRLFEETGENLTLNGVHLRSKGYQALAPILDRGLFGSEFTPSESHEKLRTTIADKNFHWWHRYRAVNGYSIWGTRGEAGSDGTYRNREVMERERTILDQMCDNRDRRIWQIAQGKPVSETVDDSSTLAFFEPKTNVGGQNDPNRKAGKLGSLDYIPAAEQQKHFRLPDGYQINLVASEEDFPELANPVALNFDSRGRLWVSTMPSYPQWQPKTKLDDKLLILEDQNGDGRADNCKVFAGGLHQPTGFEIGRGGVFVAQQPDVLFLKDTDGDDRADVRIRQLTGFCSADSHHGLSAFEWGPDGALYFQEGTFKQSQVETPYGPVRLGDAGVWRYDPRTERFEVHASLAFANPWGHVFDRWGQNFIADASPGFNYWAAPISGYVEHPDKHPGGSRTGHLDWGGSKGNREYPPFLKKRIRPTSGCEFVSSRHFPPEAQGQFLVNNVIGDLGVLSHTIRDEGSGFGGEETPPLVMCDHGNFRPVDLQFGPDGALYIVDWHNALIGHLQHNLRDPSRDHSHGRIWRVTYKNRPLLVPSRIAGQPVPELLQLLREPEDRARYRARRELAERPTDEVIAALDRWIAELESDDANDQRLLLEGLWLCQTHNVVKRDLLHRLLEASDFRVRAAATRVLSYWREQVPNHLELLAARIRDTHPRARLEAVRALSFVHTPDSMSLALDVLNYDMDVYLEYTLYETLRAIENAISHPTELTQTASGPNPAAAHMSGDGVHHHPVAVGPKPTLLLDKSPKIVQYQLDRLSPSQLVLADRSTDDRKYRPLYEAILARPGITRQDREDALAALVTLNQSDAVEELLAAIGRLDTETSQQASAAEQIAGLLLKQPDLSLRRYDAVLRGAIGSDNPAVRSVAHAAFMSRGQSKTIWDDAQRTEIGRLDYLAAVALVPNPSVRNSLRNEVLDCLEAKQPIAVRRAAIEALAHVPAQQEDTFHRLAGLVGAPQLRAAAVQTLNRVSREHRSPADAQNIVRTLVDMAAKTPAARRTTDEFLDAMQLADSLLPLLAPEEMRVTRQRLREITVRVVRINTVHEEMRYDTPYFAVEAGRPVQLVLRNEDLMPHNLVITSPGALRDVAMLAATMPSAADRKGLAYVPKTEQVLFGTRLVDSHRQDVLTFTAPSEPGEYPYVCTFPNHWMRMYGVMVVVSDLDAWLANPVKPADPLGNTREFVRNWTVEELQPQLAASLEGRSTETGRKLFKEATCLQCHKFNGEGGAVGPELTDVFLRWKGDSLAILREMLDPSHKIEPKYALYNVVMSDGRIKSGIIAAQDRDTVTILANPENSKPEQLLRDDIHELVKTSASLMPKGLLDRYTKEEIFELLAYLKTGQPTPPPASSDSH